MPKVASLAVLNERLAQADRDDDNRRIGHRIRTVGQDFALEQPLLATAAGQAVRAGPDIGAAGGSARANHGAQQSVFGARTVHRPPGRVRLRSNELLVFDNTTLIAHHQRSIRKGAQVLELDHYLKVLKIKPGALPGATALVQARAAGTFTATHEAFWAAARKAHGDAAGTRALIEVLLLHRRIRPADVITGMVGAPRVGSTSADVVAVEARLAASGRNDADDLVEADAVGVSQLKRVISLTERRLTDPAAVIAGLPPDTRPLPSLAGYDELLTHRTFRTVPRPLPTTGGVR